MMKDLIAKRGRKLLFTTVWLFFYLSFVNQNNLGEGVVNFIIYYFLLPAAIALAFIGIELAMKKSGRKDKEM